MRLARFEREPQRLARSEEVALPDDVVERARPQAFRERRGGLTLFEEVIH
jgi:hypothetical protein